MLRYIFLALLLCAMSAAELVSVPMFSARQNLGTVNNKIIDEASGIVASRKNQNVFWVHNDDGDNKELFAINRSGKILAKYKLNVDDSYDWEDIAIAKDAKTGKDYIYIGDVGDNDGDYESRQIFRVEEPVVQHNQEYEKEKIENVDVIEFTYEDGARDCETLLVDPLTNDLYLVTKREKNVRVYVLPYPRKFSDINSASFVCELEVGEKESKFEHIVGGDISPNGMDILIKSYMEIFYYSRNQGQTIKDAFLKKEETIPYSMEPQGESICWDKNGLDFYTISEQSPLKLPVNLYFYPRKNTSVLSKPQTEISLSKNRNTYTLSFGMDQSAQVSLKLYDLRGELVDVVYSKYLFEGMQKINFDCNGVMSGAYNLSINIGEQVINKKILLSK